jgi:hypothetical protein
MFGRDGCLLTDLNKSPGIFGKGGSGKKKIALSRHCGSCLYFFLD